MTPIRSTRPAWSAKLTTPPVTLLVFLVLLMSSSVWADGFIVIHTPTPVPRGHFPFAPLEVTYHRVNVTIDDHVAVTRVDQEFHNPNSQRMEGTYLFPLPAGAHIDKFSMDVDGKMMDAELLPADKARAIYEEIVRQHRDPALLEYIGRDALRVRIFPIEPHSKKQIKLQYTQLIKPDGGVSEYVYPLNTEKFSARPLREVAIKIELTTKQPLKSVYCPSHEVDIKRDGQHKATIGYEERDIRPDIDFKLIFSQEKDPVGINLLSYRRGDEGYFMLMATPGMDAPAGEVQAKDICFVLDTSGSMAGAKMEQAKKALRFCLANLNERDRFEIIRFSTEAEPLFDGLKPAGREHVERAEAFVKDLKPIGGTAIADALAKAIELGRKRDDDDAKKRPFYVIFLTDGQPTVGETSEDAIVGKVKDADGVKVFSFGIGTDINTHLLDRIAEQTKAFSTYVLPEEDIEIKVSNFYTKIKEPVLSDVEVAFSGDAKTTQIYPSSMPDLFKGEVLIVFGRYSGHGPGAVTIRGKLNGEQRTFAQDIEFTRDETRHDFIPRLWATRRVGWLLDEIRMRGENEELKEEVVRLAREHGIVTPYTAYLILEDEARRNVPIAARTMRELEADRETLTRAREYYDSARADSGRLEKAGERAVQNSQATQQLRQSQSVAGAQAPAAAPALAKGGAPADGGYRVAQNYAQQARVINGKAFYQNGTTWTDAEVQRELARRRDLKQKQIEFNSDEYFELVRAHPHAAPWLSVGSELDIVLGDTLYQIR